MMCNFSIGLSINITKLKQHYRVIENFQITYLPFNKSIEIYSVYSTLILNLNESIGDSSMPFCTLLFVNETGTVNLATNTIRLVLASMTYNHLDLFIYLGQGVVWLIKYLL